MAHVIIANLPSIAEINPRSYTIIEKPGEGEGTYKATIGDIQKATTVTANVTHNDNIIDIYIKDINGLTEERIFVPIADVTKEGNLVRIHITDYRGTTEETIFEPVVNVSKNGNVISFHMEDYSGSTDSSFVVPTAKVTDNHDGTCTLTVTDTDGQTSQTVISYLIVDPVPTQGSANFVNSGTVYTSLKQRDDKIAELTRSISQLTAIVQNLNNKIQNVESITNIVLTTEDDVYFENPYDFNGTVFHTLSDAILGTPPTGVIKLLSDATNEGLAVPEGKEFTLDLNGHSLHITGPGAGSPGTETNGMQLLKDSTIIIRNGVIDFNDSRLKMGIQNYSNLTLDNVKVSGGDTITYVVSNNYGTVIFKNGTTITPSGSNVAFDAWYGMLPAYDNGVNVVIEDSSVQINGKVEFGKANRASLDLFAQNASITCPDDMNLNVSILNPPCSWIANGDGTKTLRYTV